MAFLQLRNMEDIVNSGQSFRQFQLVSNFSTTFEDFVGANEPGCQLSFNTKPLDSTKWGRTEICSVSNFIRYLLAFTVGITLLSRLCYLESISNQLDLLFGVSDKIGTKKFSVSNTIPQQWCSTPPSV